MNDLLRFLINLGLIAIYWFLITSRFFVRIVANTDSNFLLVGGIMFAISGLIVFLLYRKGMVQKWSAKTKIHVLTYWASFGFTGLILVYWLNNTIEISDRYAEHTFYNGTKVTGSNCYCVVNYEFAGKTYSDRTDTSNCAGRSTILVKEKTGIFGMRVNVRKFKVAEGQAVENITYMEDWDESSYEEMREMEEEGEEEEDD